MTYRDHFIKFAHIGGREYIYKIDDYDEQVVDCGSLVDLERIVKRVIDIHDMGGMSSMLAEARKAFTKSSKEG